MQARQRRSQVAKAAGTTWIPDVARTAALCDMSAHADESAARAAFFDLAPKVSLVFAKAVAEGSVARRQLLPNRHADVIYAEDLTGVGHVDGVACGRWAEPERHHFQPRERRRFQ